MSDYRRLQDDDTRARPLRDHRAAWEKLKPLAEANGVVRERVEHFASRKRIAVVDLEALGARIVVRKSGAIELAYAGENGAGAVTAIKFRPLDGSSHDSRAEWPSTWLRPIIVGKRDSLDWFIAEGETDGARLHGLIGDRGAVMVLPAGALTFKREWADLIPRGATVALCHDDEEEGDQGAEKARAIIGGKILRLRPPVEGGDWCDWSGERDDFLALVAEAGTAPAGRAARIVSLDDFADVEEQGGEAVLGDSEQVVIPENGDVMVYGDGGAGKTTLCNDAACHLAAGDAWLGIRVPRPLRVLLIENEGPRPGFRKKLRRKRDAWAGSPLGDRISVLEEPWGKFTFADEGWRAALAEYVREHAIDVVVCGPVACSGMEAAGTLQEVRDFLGLVADVRRRAGRNLVVVLVHHENKGGKVSGAWEGAGDTLLHVAAQGHGRLRLFFQKARWSSDWHAKTLQLAWAEGDSFAIVEEEEKLSDDEVAEQVLTHIGGDPGMGWSAVVKATPGVGSDRRRAVRDRLLADRLIFNLGRDENGADGLLNYLPPKKRSRLFLASDPTIQHLRRDSGAVEAQSAPPTGENRPSATAPCAPPIRGAGAGADSPPPEESRPCPDCGSFYCATPGDARCLMRQEEADS